MLIVHALTVVEVMSMQRERLCSPGMCAVCNTRSVSSDIKMMCGSLSDQSLINAPKDTEIVIIVLEVMILQIRIFIAIRTNQRVLDTNLS